MFQGFSWSWRCVKRRRSPSDPFFQDGDLVCCIARKQLTLDISQLVDKRIEEFACSVSRCMKTFDSVSSYELHYNSIHRNVCATCGKTYPSNHLLDLHILESHDSLFEILATRQKMYQCLVEECQIKFLTPVERKDHLIRVHHYPSNFRFQRRKHKRISQKGMCSTTEAMQVDIAPVDDIKTEPPTMETMEQATSCQTKRIFSYRVPRSISFGHGVARGFNSRRGKVKKNKHWHQQTGADSRPVNIETVKMDELVTALED